MIYVNSFKLPAHFQSQMHVAICICESKDTGNILLLLRAGDKPEGGKWGFPAGKQKDGESITETAQRELLEETGLDIRFRDISFFRTAWVIYPATDKPERHVTCHLFHISLNSQPSINLNEEHTEHLWLLPENALKLNLMYDEDETIKRFLIDIKGWRYCL